MCWHAASQCPRRLASVVISGVPGEQPQRASGPFIHRPRLLGEAPRGVDSLRLP